MIETAYDRGIFLPQAELWLDPRDRKDLAFVSHAHSDHTGRHRRILCTPATARLMQVRMGPTRSAFETIPFHERRGIAGGAVTLLPAGHVLGSAQFHFQSEAGSLLFTGDFKLRPGLSAETASSVAAETLIMETTFGLPRYHFPPVEETAAAVRKFCLEALEENHTPVLLGYALGKSQEILALLRGTGVPITLHQTIAQVTAVYEEFGISFPAYDILGEDPPKGVLICPPGIHGSKAIAKLRKRRVAMLSGWAMDPAASRRMQVDAAFPLSDHADYQDLLRHVEAVNPRRVLTLHGFAQEFARDLRALGREAWALTGANQLELRLPQPATRIRATASALKLANTGFNAFCLMAETLRAAAGKNEKTRILTAYFQALPEDDILLAIVWLSGRALLQNEERQVHNASAIIRRALRMAAGISELELRTIGRRHNDLGAVALEVLQSVQGEETLPLHELHGIFERFHGTREPVRKTEILTTAFQRVPAQAGCCLVWILVGGLRLGLKDDLLENVIDTACADNPDTLRKARLLLRETGGTTLPAKPVRVQEAELALFEPSTRKTASPERASM